MFLCTLLAVSAVQAGGESETFPLTGDHHIPSYSLDTERYGYRLLNTAEDREIYEMIREAVADSVAAITVPAEEGKHLFGIFMKVLNDYPEYFWVDSRLNFTTRSIDSVPVDVKIDFTYTSSGDDLVKQKDKVADITGKVVKSTEKVSDPYEKVKRVYEYLITETKYRSSVTDQSMYSVLVKGKGVCAGYARSFQYLMHVLGFESIIVTGDLKQNGDDGGVLSLFTPFIPEELNGHAWNMVKLGERWYHVDVTSGEALTPMNKDISYNFLTVPTEQILTTHTINPEEVIPVSASYDLEYYRTHGLFFDSFSLKEYRKLFRQAEKGKERDLDIRFSSAAVLQEAVNVLLGDQKIFEMIDDDEVSYFVDTIHSILSVDIP